MPIGKFVSAEPFKAGNLPVASNFTILLAPIPLFNVNTGVEVVVATLISVFADVTEVTVPLYCGIFNVPLLKVAAPVVPVVVSVKGAAKAPEPFKKVVLVPEPVPRRAAGMVPIVAEPSEVTTALPIVAVFATVVTDTLVSAEPSKAGSLPVSSN